MPRVPRDCNAERLAKLLRRYGYERARQTGSHIRLHSDAHDHSITVPNHDPIKIGTLSAILTDVATATGTDKTLLIEQL